MTVSIRLDRETDLRGRLRREGDLGFKASGVFGVAAGEPDRKKAIRRQGLAADVNLPSDGGAETT